MSSGPSRRNLSVDSKDFDASSQPIQLCSTPSDVHVDQPDVGRDLQLELIVLHCDEQLKSRFVNRNSLDSWRSHVRTLPRLADIARRVAALSGFAYMHEQLVKKLVKSHTRAQLTNEHLQGTLLLFVSDVVPDFRKLASAKQHHPSL